MDKLLDKAQISDLLGLLAPGYLVVALVQLVTPELAPTRVVIAVSRSELLLTVSSLIAAYVAGMILNAAVNVGTRQYILDRMTSDSAANNPEIRLAPPKIRYFMVNLLFWMPLPRFDQSIVAVFMRISGVIEQASRVKDSIDVLGPWEQLELYRVYMASGAAREAMCLMDAAERLHSRLLFALAVSLVASFAAFAAVISCAVTLMSGTLDSRPMFFFGAWSITSYMLRLIAGRLWEHELLLVASMNTGGSGSSDGSNYSSEHVC